jgi:hypothetical protein
VDKATAVFLVNNFTIVDYNDIIDTLACMLTDQQIRVHRDSAIRSAEALGDGHPKYRRFKGMTVIFDDVMERRGIKP